MYRILSSERIELPRFAVLDRSGPEPPQEIKLFKISYTECSLIDARSYMYLINSYFDNLFSYSNSNREILIFTLVYYATVTNLDMSWCQLAFFSSYDQRVFCPSLRRMMTTWSSTGSSSTNPLWRSRSTPKTTTSSSIILPPPVAAHSGFFARENSTNNSKCGTGGTALQVWRMYGVKEWGKRLII